MTYVRQPVQFLTVDTGSEDEKEGVNALPIRFGGPGATQWGRVVALGLFEEMEGGTGAFITPVTPHQFEPCRDFYINARSLHVKWKEPKKMSENAAEVSK